MNDDGVYFPVWGTCLGMEQMTTWPLNPPQNLLSNCTGAEAIPLPVNFTKEASTSKLYGNAPSYILDTLANEKITPNFHSFCLSMKTYLSNPALRSFYTVTTTNTDSSGLVYASSMESKQYPFYGVQWHPEMINFWHSNKVERGITNSMSGAMVSQYCATCFVEEAIQMNGLHDVGFVWVVLYLGYKYQCQYWEAGLLGTCRVVWEIGRASCRERV